MTAPATYPHEAAPIGVSAALAADLRALLPRIETSRLILRAPVVADFATYRAITMSDRARYMYGARMSREQCWLDFSQIVAGWLLRGHGLVTIEDRDTGTVHGFCLIHFEIDEREPALGWFLTEAAEGHGIACEAARALRDWGIETMRLPSLVSYIDPDNTRSIALAERLDAWRDPDAEAALDDNGGVFVYRHHPPRRPQ